MKKSLKLLVINALLILGFTSSCEDSYNIVQDGEFSEELITTVDGMQSYLNGLYAQVSIANEIGFSSIFTDEVGVGRGSGGQNFTTHRFILNANDPFANGIWYGKYAIINRVNRLLVIANQVPTPSDPTQLATYNSIIAQARALRAFAYLQLLTYFSPDMSDNNALGVILTTSVNEASDDLPRSTNGPIYELMESDLEFAFNNVISNAVEYKYVSKSMINALRARLYLYRKNYPLAKQYALDVINNYGITLTTSANVPSGTPGSGSWNTSFYGGNTVNLYRRMWADLPASTPPVRYEQIFSLDRPAAPVAGWENIASLFTTNTTNVAGSPLWEVSRSLFNKFLERPNDIRRYANVDPTSLINPNYATDSNYLDSDVIVIDKYPGKTGVPLRNDVKVFRLSEMYLILAECYAHEGAINGATSSAAWAVKSIRDARAFPAASANTPLPVYANATDAFLSIMEERYLELCFEGHRYIDVKRLGPLTGTSIQRDATDDIIQNVLTIPNNDYRFTLPIPQDEINANPGIQRNPGY